MPTTISRRRFLTISAATLATAATARSLSAQTTDASGGIGWPREVFDQRYGTGRPSGDLLVYPNPYLEGSQLSVLFENDIATFIDISIPQGATVDATILINLLPQDAVALGAWNLPSVDGTPNWQFQEYRADSMNMAGSGATKMQTTVAYRENRLVRATVSLAIPGGASLFSPATGSVGPGANMDAWTSIYGEGTDGHAAAGSYDGTWMIDPWDKVVVYSQRGEGAHSVLTDVSAISFTGVDPDSAFAFAQSILPQTANLQSAYSAWAAPGAPQGWGMSTWAISESDYVLLFMLGAGDGSDSVLQVASMLWSI